MLLDALLIPILSLFNFLFAALPTASMTWLTSNDSLITKVDSWAAAANFVVPMQLVVILTAVFVGVFLPAIFIYELAQWAYREIPHVLGTGS
jgi:hypothetical protein